MSRTAFAARFPDDAACAHHLYEKRWPKGFICPKCQGLKSKRPVTHPLNLQAVGRSYVANSVNSDVTSD